MLTRRRLLILGPAALAAQTLARSSLRGIFPIMQTPFTEDDKVDFPVLVKQANFLARAGAHGMVWPQLASEYSTLSTAERLAGAEALLSVRREVGLPIVIGVQAPETRQAVEYARHAARLQADALIALPPPGEPTPTALRDYYQAIGAAAPIPLFIQAVGKFPLDEIIALARAVPTLRYVKDEAAPVLNRLTELRARAPELRSFTGGHGKTLYEEIQRGAAGSMPAAGFADLYAAAWDLYDNGRRREAAEMCARFSLFVALIDAHGMEVVKYILYLRGVFPNFRMRSRGRGTFDAAAQRSLAEVVAHLRPWFRV